MLSHEIAHIERGDVATQTIGLFACALLWFHPLAWFALARLRRESESAADDRVICAGTSSIAYATHLGFDLRWASALYGGLHVHLGKRSHIITDQ